MSEVDAWTAIRPHFHRMGLDPVRVENVLHPGFPDVSYTRGLIELKQMAAFPIRPSTLVRVPKYSGEQAGFLTRRWVKGGLSWLLVRVGREWFLWSGSQAIKVWRGMTQESWQLTAYRFSFPMSEGSLSGLKHVLLTGQSEL